MKGPLFTEKHVQELKKSMNEEIGAMKKMMEENLKKMKNDFDSQMQAMETRFEDMKNQMEWEDEPEDAEEIDPNEEMSGKVLYFLKVI